MARSLYYHWDLELSLKQFSISCVSGDTSEINPHLVYSIYIRAVYYDGNFILTSAINGHQLIKQKHVSLINS
jgi:hypothetical protein